MKEQKKFIAISECSSSLMARRMNQLIAEGWDCHGEMFCKQYNASPSNYTQFMWRWVYVDEAGQEVDLSQEKNLFEPARPTPIPTT